MQPKDMLTFNTAPDPNTTFSIDTNTYDNANTQYHSGNLPQLQPSPEEVRARLQQLMALRWELDRRKRAAVTQPQKDKKKAKNRSKAKLAKASRKRNR